jgi:hypothetical protein
VADGSTTFNSVSDPTQALEALYSLLGSDFHDITSGYNGFSAGSGYDDLTGLGSPVANLLIPGLVSYGEATQFGRLAIAVEPPGSVAAGSAFGLTVVVEDSSGSVITSYNAIVAIALASNPGGATLGGDPTALVTNGVATFSGLTLNKPGSGYTLRVSGGSVAPVTTAPISVSASGSQSPLPTPTPSPSPPPSQSPTSTPSPAPAPSPRAAPGVFGTQTSLTTKSRAWTFGQPVTLTAAVKIIGRIRAMPAGTVTFTDGSTILATVQLHGGKSSFTTSTLPIGQNVIRAAYAGASDARSSRSSPVFKTIRAVKSKARRASLPDLSGFMVRRDERFVGILARDESRSDIDGKRP